MSSHVLLILKINFYTENILNLLYMMSLGKSELLALFSADFEFCDWNGTW